MFEDGVSDGTKYLKHLRSSVVALDGHERGQNGKPKFCKEKDIYADEKDTIIRDSEERLLPTGRSGGLSQGRRRTFSDRTRA